MLGDLVDCVGEKSGEENPFCQKIQLLRLHVGLVEAPKLEESVEQVVKEEDRQAKHVNWRTRPVDGIQDQKARPAE